MRKRTFSERAVEAEAFKNGGGGEHSCYESPSKWVRGEVKVSLLLFPHPLLLKKDGVRLSSRVMASLGPVMRSSPSPVAQPRGSTETGVVSSHRLACRY